MKTQAIPTIRKALTDAAFMAESSYTLQGTKGAKQHLRTFKKAQAQLDAHEKIVRELARTIGLDAEALDNCAASLETVIAHHGHSWSAADRAGREQTLSEAKARATASRAVLRRAAA